MVTKQSASKTSGNIARDAGAKPSSAIIVEEQSHFWSMNMLPERGYDLAKASQSFLSTVENLGWDLFVQHRTYYIEQIVREFYAGIQDTKGGKVIPHSIVRGRRVFFDSERINNHFVLACDSEEFENKVKHFGKKEMKEVASRIAVKGAPWEKFTHTEFKMKSKYLVPGLGNWHLFIDSSIIPTSHTFTLTKERLLLLDAILTESNADIGTIISKKIMDLVGKNTGFLFYPCLITDLCRKQGVNITTDEKSQRKFPPGPLSAKFTGKKKQEAGPVMQEHFVQKMKAVWKFQDEQHDWLQLRLREISDKDTDLEAPIFPKWVLDGDEEEGSKEEQEESEKEKRKPKRKRGDKKDVKGKKTWSEEELMMESDEDTEEDEELQRKVKQIDRDEKEDEEATDSEEDEYPPEPEFQPQNSTLEESSGLVITHMNFAIEKDTALQVIQENPEEERGEDPAQQATGAPTSDEPASDAVASQQMPSQVRKEMENPKTKAAENPLQENPKEVITETVEYSAQIDVNNEPEQQKEKDPAAVEESGDASAANASASNASASDPSALNKLAETATTVDAPESKAAAPKEKRQRVQSGPVRSSSRLRSGAKKF